jgi:hypothetical protein
MSVQMVSCPIAWPQTPSNRIDSEEEPESDSFSIPEHVEYHVPPPVAVPAPASVPIDRSKLFGACCADAPAGATGPQGNCLSPVDADIYREGSQGQDQSVMIRSVHRTQAGPVIGEVSNSAGSTALRANRLTEMGSLTCTSAQAALRAVVRCSQLPRRGQTK